MSGWQRIPDKQWFNVLISTQKYVKIYAVDEEEAKEKADSKYGPKWNAEDAWTDEPQKREPSCTCGHPQCFYCSTEVIIKSQTSQMDFCVHVYRNVGEMVCPYCGKPTHETDWVEQNRLAKEWKEKNPNPTYGGWWSI